MERRKARPGTGTSAACAIFRCCSSTSLATSNSEHRKCAQCRQLESGSEAGDGGICEPSPNTVRLGGAAFTIPDLNIRLEAGVYS